MTTKSLLTAAAATVLVAGLAAHAQAQTPTTAKTEAAAEAATGKPTTDAPATTEVQGTAKAVQEGAAPVATTAIKPVTMQGDLVDTLKLNGQFTTFVKGLDSTNLTGLLKTNKNLTVFAPTDAAFAAMPPAELTKLQTDKTAMQRFLLHHIINAPVDTSKIKGAKGPVPTGAGDNVMLDGSAEDGALKVDGATIVQADVHTGSGLLHVVDHVLVAGQGTASAEAASGAATGADASAAAEKPQG